MRTPDPVGQPLNMLSGSHAKAHRNVCSATYSMGAGIPQQCRAYEQEAVALLVRIFRLLWALGGAVVTDARPGEASGIRHDVRPKKVSGWGRRLSGHPLDEVPLSRMLTMEYSEKQIAPSPTSTRAGPGRPLAAFQVTVEPDPQAAHGPRWSSHGLPVPGPRPGPSGKRLCGTVCAHRPNAGDRPDADLRRRRPARRDHRERTYYNGITHRFCTTVALRNTSH